jgi:hypothetical protein
VRNALDELCWELERWIRDFLVGARPPQSDPQLDIGATTEGMDRVGPRFK